MRRLNEGSDKASLWSFGLGVGNTYEDVRTLKVPHGNLKLKIQGKAGMNVKTGEVNQLWRVSGYSPDNADGFIEVDYYCDNKKEAEAFADKVSKFNFVEGVSYLIRDENTSNWDFKG